MIIVSWETGHKREERRKKREKERQEIYMTKRVVNVSNIPEIIMDMAHLSHPSHSICPWILLDRNMCLVRCKFLRFDSVHCTRLFKQGQHHYTHISTYFYSLDTSVCVCLKTKPQNCSQTNRKGEDWGSFSWFVFAEVLTLAGTAITVISRQAMTWVTSRSIDASSIYVAIMFF